MIKKYKVEFYVELHEEVIANFLNEPIHSLITKAQSISDIKVWDKGEIAMMMPLSPAQKDQ